jgi:hypothetical protein
VPQIAKAAFLARFQRRAPRFGTAFFACADNMVRLLAAASGLPLTTNFNHFSLQRRGAK